MQNPECATQYSNYQFSILAKARSMFHLSVLKATYIKMSTTNKQTTTNKFLFSRFNNIYMMQI